MELFIYNHDLELLGIIDDATSIIWHRRYYTAGDFEIIMPVNQINIELIQKQFIITKKDSVECGIIENISIEQSEEGELLKAIGRFGSSLLARRIVFSTTVINDTYENAMRQLVYENAINPDNTDRVIPDLELGTLNSFTETVQFQVSYRNLLNTLKSLSETSGIGFRIRFDTTNKKFYFETYKALDRSVNQSANSRVIFSNDYDNLLASIYQSSDMEYSNVALVGGEGEGEERKMVIVGSGSGLERYEVFVNAKDVRMEDGITEPEYFAMLATKGAQSLMPKVEYFEGNVLAESNVIYKSDYDLGDVVTIENTKWGKRINVQITEITEVYDENGNQVIPVFGQSMPALSDAIPEEDTSGTGGGGSDIVVTPNRVLVSNSSGMVAASNISDTELSYLSGVTSNIQTQLNNKQNTITGAASTIVSSNLTANRALVSDASGKVAVSSATLTELSYLSGVTSNIQTQLNNKQNTITGAASTIVSSNLTANRALVSDASGKVAVSSATLTELGYLSGVTSNIQTQLNAKANNTITVSAGNGLTGGGNLTANRTLTLGTPSSITPSSTNSVTSTSHTHEITGFALTDDGIVAQGSSGGQYWVAYGDGTLLKYGDFARTTAISTAFGNLFLSTQDRITFNTTIPFIAPPQCFPANSDNTNNNRGTWCALLNVTSTYFDYQQYSATSRASQSWQVRWYAIGRWK